MHKVTLRLITVITFAFSLSACTDSSQTEVVSVTHTVKSVGVPAPQYNLQNLRDEADLSEPIELAGVWNGKFDYYSNDRLSRYVFKLEVQESSNGFQIHALKGISSEDTFRSVKYLHPNITFEYYGFLNTPEGDNIPLMADFVVVDEDLIQGHFKHLLSERGGKQHFSEFDVSLKRTPF